MTCAHGITPQQLATIDVEVARLIDEAVAFAETSPDPEASDLLTDVYIKY